MRVVAELLRLESRRPAITALLNGQAVKVAFGSTSVTSKPLRLQLARAGGAGKAAADHDDPRRRLRERRRGQQGGRAARGAELQKRTAVERGLLIGAYF